MKNDNDDDQGKLFDDDEGSRRRDEGIERAKNHADRVQTEWSDDAYNYFVGYLRTHRLFSTEEVREYALRNGFMDAPDGRAWGAIAVRARKAGLIVHDHFESARNIKKHRCPLRIWRSKVK